MLLCHAGWTVPVMGIIAATNNWVPPILVSVSVPMVRYLVSVIEILWYWWFTCSMTRVCPSICSSNEWWPGKLREGFGSISGWMLIMKARLAAKFVKKAFQSTLTYTFLSAYFTYYSNVGIGSIGKIWYWWNTTNNHRQCSLQLAWNVCGYSPYWEWHTGMWNLAWPLTPHFSWHMNSCSTYFFSATTLMRLSIILSHSLSICMKTIMQLAGELHGSGLITHSCRLVPLILYGELQWVTS